MTAAQPAVFHLVPGRATRRPGRPRNTTIDIMLELIAIGDPAQGGIPAPEPALPNGGWTEELLAVVLGTSRQYVYKKEAAALKRLRAFLKDLGHDYRDVLCGALGAGPKRKPTTTTTTTTTVITTTTHHE